MSVRGSKLRSSTVSRQTSGKRSRRLFTGALSALSLALSLRASAQQPPDAERLFREGRKLLAEGQLAEACDKFAESERVEPSAGALLNLARCHADAGMTGTAWSEYLAAARLARGQERPQQAAEAELRAAELQPRLLRLRIELDAASGPGVVVARNGVELAASDLNVPAIVDPGSQVIRATAPGHAEWSTTVLVTRPGQLRTVRVPPLTPLPAVVTSAPARSEREHAAAADAPPPASHGISARAWVTGGLGAAALVSSGVLALVAKSKWDQAHDSGDCDASHACNRAGLDTADQARRLGNSATGLALAGAAAGLGGALFYFYDARSRRAAVHAHVAAGPASITLELRGAF
jgi:tetratricopeptide (TPR) repeat protein